MKRIGPRVALTESMMNKHGIVAMGLVGVFLIAGCVVGPSEPDTVTGEWKKISWNKMSIAQMAAETASADALDLLAAGDIAGLDTSPESLELMFYAVKCALNDGQVVIFQGEALEGLFGFADQFPYAPLTLDQQEWMTACLEAHVNAFRVAIPFSARGDHPNLHWPDANELAQFIHHEAGFAGNMFDSLDRSKFACTGDDVALAYSNPTGYMGKRACGRSGPGGPGSSCDFEVSGECRGPGEHTTESTQKDGGDVDAHRRPFPDPASSGTKAFRNLTSYLRAGDLEWQDEVLEVTEETGLMPDCDGVWVYSGGLECFPCLDRYLGFDTESGDWFCGEPPSPEGAPDITDHRPKSEGE